MRPTGRFIFLFSLVLIPALLPALWLGFSWKIWAVSAVVLLVLLLLDFVLSPVRSAFQVSLQNPTQIYIGESEFGSVRIEQDGKVYSGELKCVFDLESEFEPVDVWEGQIPDDGVLTIPIPLVPKRRGKHKIEAVSWGWTGPLGLASISTRQILDAEILVVPNIRQVRDAAIRFMSNPEFLSGIKAERYLGEGSEFDRMREFHPGMDSRNIDWKASARHRRLLSRQYRLERNHQVVISFDTSHLMGQPIYGIPRLDHAVNAGLLLAWCCLKAQDRVVIHAFDDQVRHFSDLHVGTKSMAHVQRATGQFDYGMAEANYTLAMTDLSVRLKRRSLVVVLTEFADSVTAEIMVENLLRLARRHLVLFVALRDHELSDFAKKAPDDMGTIGRSVVAQGMIEDRARVIRKLELAGILCLDIEPKDLSSSLVSTYLDIKSKERI